MEKYKKYNSFVDFGKAFDKVMNETFINYKGHILEKSGTGYIYSGKYYSTLKEVDEYLKTFYQQWNEDIIKQNNGK